MALLPEVADAAGWRAAKARPEGWLPALAEIARRHGLPTPAREDLQPAGDVVALAGRSVIKLWAPLFLSEHHAEVAVLRHLAGELPVPVPALEAVGALEGWPYVVMSRLPGRVATRAWPELSVPQRAVVLRDLGEALAGLHARPRPVAVDADWTGFVAVHRAKIVDHHARTPAPRAWLPQLERWLDAVPLDEPGDRLLHGDVNIGNLMVGEDGRLCGLLDFGDARIGAPAFDLATPLLFLADATPALVHALLDGWGASADRSEWPRRLLAWALLHPCSDMTRFVPAPWPDDLDALALRSFPL